MECGWIDEVTMLCKEKLKDRLSKGQEVKSITENDLFNDIAPDARSMFCFIKSKKICYLRITILITVIEKLPDTIKRELKVKVQNKLLQTAGYFDETDSES